MGEVVGVGLLDGRGILGPRAVLRGLALWVGIWERFELSSDLISLFLHPLPFFGRPLFLSGLMFCTAVQITHYPTSLFFILEVQLLRKTCREGGD